MENVEVATVVAPDCVPGGSVTEIASSIPNKEIKEEKTDVAQKRRRVRHRKRDKESSKEENKSVKSECEDKRSKPKVSKPEESTASVEKSLTVSTERKRRRRNRKRSGGGNKDDSSQSENKSSKASTSVSKNKSTTNEKSSGESNQEKNKKRRFRKGQKKNKNSIAVQTTVTDDGSRPTSSSPSLQADGIALIEALQHKRKSDQAGSKITVSDLMTGNMKNYRPAPQHSQAMGQAILDAALKVPHVPGFPSLLHRRDTGPFSASLSPELFKTTMEAARVARNAHLGLTFDTRGGGSRDSLSGDNSRPLTPDQLLPWINLDPMFPFDGRGSRPPQSSFQSRPGSGSPPEYRRLGGSSSSCGWNGSIGIGSQSSGGAPPLLHRNPFPLSLAPSFSASTTNGAGLHGSIGAHKRNSTFAMGDNRHVPGSFHQQQNRLGGSSNQRGMDRPQGMGHFQPHSYQGQPQRANFGGQFQRDGYNHMGGGPRGPPQNHQIGGPNIQGGPQGGQQKTRKPLFMPYQNIDVVERGLRSLELIKGILRVNQRNYEESYIDNPLGDDQMDILILGVHDRNRALHGDVVVVKPKERIHWVVRESLYKSWRSGELNVSKDDNGQPLTIPPLSRTDDDLIEVALGGLSELRLTKEEAEREVPVEENSHYDRSAMINIGVQLELERRKHTGEVISYDQQPGFSKGLPKPEVQATIDELAIRKTFGVASKSHSVSTINGGFGSAKKAVSAVTTTPRKQTNKRPTLRTLADMPDEDWGMPDICLQKTAEVVYIWEQRNCRAATGQLKVMTDGNPNWALFSPTDSRMPRMMIPRDQLPQGFHERPQDFARFIFLARMEEWQATQQFARGNLERTLGLAGDIEAETEGLLCQNDVDTREFSPCVLNCLPISESQEWTIPEKELNYRKDLRDEVIFTIDPKTARDLDDALSVKPIEDCDGNGKPGFEVGVHIADVTHFVYENNELDMWAAQRATSVYLVHKVIPMLPRILCEELCSLQPGVDRLTFSVVWKMDQEGNVYDEWFGRSIIRSRSKLAYEHAQDFIDHPDKEFSTEELPAIHDEVTIDVLKSKTLLLDSIARNLRRKRQEGGALRLDQPKLKFVLDDDMKTPIGVAVYEQNDANRLVEEYMLLANMAVARKIEHHYPKVSLLRRHPPPKQKVMREVLEICEKIGFPLDARSSNMLSASLNKYNADTQLQRSINQVLSMLMMKPMQLAVYFCTGKMKSKQDYQHYALNAPFYTHFTSPIRRYADVMVHRLLAAALGYQSLPNRTIDEVEKQAEHCNEKKVAAKTVSDASAETFFGLFVKQCGPVEERGVVVNVLDAAFDVLVFKYGIIKRVYVNRLDMAREPTFSEGPPSRLTLFWNPSSGGRANEVIEQTVQLCTVVDVVLTALPEPTKFQAVIKARPQTETHTLKELLDKQLTLS